MALIADDLELFQAAMPLIGASVPSSMDDQSPESIAARASYEIFVCEALGRHAWSWGRKSETLAYVGATDSQPAYAYSLPADVLTPRRVLLAGVPFRDFEMRGGKLLCGIKDSTKIEMIYQYRAPEGDWPADFVDAMVHRLASRLAMGLLDRAKQGQALEQQAEFYLRRAMRRDRRTYPGTDPEPDPVLVRAWRGSVTRATTA